MTGTTNHIAVKESVRARDGYKCVDCRMTHESHIAKYRKRLDVHRLIPRSEYTIDGCVTVCRKCHRCRHRRKSLGGVEFPIDTDETVRMAVKLAAMKVDKSPSEIVNKILREALKNEMADAKKYAPKKKPADGEQE